MEIKLPDPTIPASYEYLQKIRQAKNLALTPNDFIKPDVVLRYYQIVAVMHMLKLTRMVLGDGTGLGKSICSIVTYSYILSRDPGKKLLLVCPKSATNQWIGEFEKFTKGIVCQKLENFGIESRREQYESFWRDPSKNVMVMHYHFFREDYRVYEQYLPKDFILVLDEVTACKSYTSKVHKVAELVSAKATRVYGLTATLLKNNLMEGYGIYKVIYEPLFGTITKFKQVYCIEKKQRIPGSKRQIPIVVGYKNIDHFRTMIDPFFLGRNKYDVTSDLPSLITKEVECALSEDQWSYYSQALGDILTVVKDGELLEKEMNPLTRIGYFQQIVNHPETIGLEGKSEKETELYRLLDEELSGEKIIIYSKYKKMINILDRELNKKGYSITRITGDENDEDVRELNKLLFQEDMETIKRWLISHCGPDADPRIKNRVMRSCKEQLKRIRDKDFPQIILLTPAGTEALNLQAASTFIFYDGPWAPGDYDQLLGRMIRIGSKHESVIAIHLVCKGTVDDHILEILKKKSKVIRQVLGDQTKGALEFDHDSDIRELLDKLKEDAQKIKISGKRSLLND
jgi:SNF2 family DNA or RNA helicase